MTDRNPDWNPILKNGAKLKLAPMNPQVVSHVSKEQKFTVSQAVQIPKTYAEWLEAHPEQSSLKTGPQELPVGQTKPCIVFTDVQSFYPTPRVSAYTLGFVLSEVSDPMDESYAKAGRISTANVRDFSILPTDPKPIPYKTRETT